MTLAHFTFFFFFCLLHRCVTDLSTDDFDFLSASNNVNPSHPDHQLLLGHFMYVDSVYAKHFQEVAKLTSPMTTAPMAGCLTFYYQRDQERGNMFSLFSRDQLGHYEEIWRPEVYFTLNWTMVSVDIKAPHPLQVSTGQTSWLQINAFIHMFSLSEYLVICANIERKLHICILVVCTIYCTPTDNCLLRQTLSAW